MNLLFICEIIYIEFLYLGQKNQTENGRYNYE